MEILSNPSFINLGIKYASRLDKKRLVEKLTDLAARLLDGENEENTIKVSLMVYPCCWILVP